MQRVLIYSFLLIAGMGLSQLPFIDPFREEISTLTMIFLAYIMIEVEMELRSISRGCAAMVSIM